MQQEDIHQYRLSVKRWKAAARHAAGRIQLPDEVKAYYRDFGKFRDYYVAIELLENLPKRVKSIADIYIKTLKNEAIESNHLIEMPPSLPMPPPVSYSKIRSTIKTLQAFQINVKDAESIHTLRKHCKDILYIGEDKTLHAHLNLQDTDFIRFKKWSTELGDIHDLYMALSLCKNIRKKNHWKQIESIWLLEYLKARYTIQALRFAIHFNEIHHQGKK